MLHDFRSVEGPGSSAPCAIDLHTGAEPDEIGGGSNVLCRHCRVIGAAEPFVTIETRLMSAFDPWTGAGRTLRVLYDVNGCGVRCHIDWEGRNNPTDCD
jgi:hypothetical protein